MKALRDNTGAATAETAIVMVAVSALLALIMGVGAMFISQAQLSEGARTVAREVMRGEDPSSAEAAGAAVAGDDASFSIGRAGEYVTVTATRDITIGGPLVQHTFTLHADASTRLEPHLVGDQ